MSNHEKIALCAAIAIGLIGLALELTIDGNYFSRSGSLIVIIGVVFGLLDLPDRLADIDNWARKQAEDHRPQAIKTLLSDGGDVDENMAAVAYRNASRIVIDEINDMARKKRKSLFLFEGLILIFGTAIWGFGDLVKPVLHVGN